MGLSEKQQLNNILDIHLITNVCLMAVLKNVIEQNKQKEEEA